MRYSFLFPATLLGTVTGATLSSRLRGQNLCQPWRGRLAWRLDRSPAFL